MFPPKETSEVEAWVGGLYESLHRAGIEFTGESCITPTGDKIDIALFLNDAMTPAIKTLTLGYAKQYARASGWKVHHAKFVRNYLLLVASSRA